MKTNLFHSFSTMPRFALVALLVAITLVPTYVLAAGDGKAGQPWELTRWGAGARALGMGRAYTALANDASGMYWNPAGLSGADRFQITGMYATLYLDTRYNFAAASYPIGQIGTIGLSWVNLAMTNIEKRDSLNFVLGSFSDNQMAFALGFGRKVPLGFVFADMGINIKYFMHSMDDQSASGFGGIDFGALVPIPTRFPLKLGFNVQNIASGNIAGDTAPISVKAGLSSGYEKLIVGDVDIEFVSGGDFTPKIGIEVNPLDFLSVRGGYSMKEVTAGLGFQFEMSGLWKVDYAVGLTHELGNDFVRASLSYFGAPPDYCSRFDELMALPDLCGLEARDNFMLIANRGGNYPCVPMAYVRLATCSYMSESWDASLADFEKGYNTLTTVFGGDMAAGLADEKVGRVINFASHAHYTEGYMFKSDWSKAIEVGGSLKAAGGGGTLTDKARLDYLLAYSEYKLGNLDVAAGKLDGLIKAFPHDPVITPMAYMTLGDILRQQSKPEEAIEKYDVVTREFQAGFIDSTGTKLDFPKFPYFGDNNAADDAMYSIGLCYKDQGKTAEAQVAFLKVLRFYPDLARAADAAKELGR